MKKHIGLLVITTSFLFSISSFANTFEKYSIVNCSTAQGCDELAEAVSQQQLFTKQFEEDDFLLKRDSFSFQDSDQNLDDDIRNKILVDSINLVEESFDDKRKHFYSGRAVGILGEAFCESIEMENLFLCRISAATVAGVLKEVYDSTGRGDVEVNDALATSAGAIYFLKLKFRMITHSS